ncbi:MAG: MATE family efflux transporter [Treponema sp.]|nr:MATE family efflux transporter [Treponema sp.]
MSKNASQDKTVLFETMPVPQAVMKLCIPAIMGTLVMVLYSIADTYFVGMTGDPIQNAAVTLAGPVLMAFNAVNNLFGVGTSSMMSRGLGRKDYDAVARSSAFGFYGALFFAIIFAVGYTAFQPFFLNMLGATDSTVIPTRDYLFWTCTLGAVPAIMNVTFSHLVRSEGGALIASAGAMSGCILNMILDPFFILPQFLGMGVVGAGLATFIGNCAACLVFAGFLLVKRGQTYVCIDPRKFGFKKEIVLGIFAVGIPACIQNLLNVTGMTIQNNLAAGYGSDVVASMGIAGKINVISFYIAMAIGQGVMPIIGYNFAAKNSQRMKDVLKFTIKVDVAFLAVTTFIYMTFAPQLVRMFLDNDIIVNYGKNYLRLMSTAIPFLCMDFLAIGIFQACGFGKYALFFAFLRKIILEIPAIILLNYLIPVYGIGCSQTVAEVGMCIASIFLIKKVFKKIAES